MSHFFFLAFSRTLSRCILDLLTLCISLNLSFIFFISLSLCAIFWIIFFKLQLFLEVSHSVWSILLSLFFTYILCFNTKHTYFILIDHFNIPEIFIGLILPYFVSICAFSWCCIFLCFLAVFFNFRSSEIWFWNFASYDFIS